MTFTGVNDAPTVTTNTLTISECGTGVLADTGIAASETDTAPGALTYTASAITGGQFEFVAAPGVATTTFTQADIDGGLVQFVHDGGAKNWQKSGAEDRFLEKGFEENMPELRQIIIDGYKI